MSIFAEKIRAILDGITLTGPEADEIVTIVRRCTRADDPARKIGVSIPPRVSYLGETVNHPSHYGGDVPHETYKCLKAWGLESCAMLWNAAKYISRAGKKGSRLEDLKKARWYLAKAIEAEEEEEGNGSRIEKEY